MVNFIRELEVNPQIASEEIEIHVRTMLKKLNRDGAVISVSGGLDSAVAATLTVRSLGVKRVHLLNMPERDSKPVHKKHAKLLADHLGAPLTIKNITPIVCASGAYRLLPLGYIPSQWIRKKIVDFGKTKYLDGNQDNILANRLHPEPGTWVAKGNAYAVAKHRLRVVMVYQFAELNNFMVVGAANRTEWLTGTFSKWGIDHCADIMPLMHLFRSQLEQIADYIQVPAPIRNKRADPDVMPGIDDKGDMLGDFATVDQVLYALENNQQRDHLIQEYGHELVTRCFELFELSRHMRESPYHLLA